MIIAITIVGILLMLLAVQWGRERNRTVGNVQELYTLQGLLSFVSAEMKERCYARHKHRANAYENRHEARQELLLQALRRCTYGALPDKAYVKSVISEIIEHPDLEQERVLSLLPFESPSLLSPMDCFDALLFQYHARHGDQGFKRLVKDFNWDAPRYNEHSEVYFEIDAEMVMQAYFSCGVFLTAAERKALVVQRLYQHYKGFSVIDHLREMSIDGISGGVSGSVGAMANFDLQADAMKAHPMTYDSIWVFFEGKSVNLSFMSFGSEAELKRVCQNIYRYNNVGMLSKDIGYKINDMVDGSRVVVVRPDFSESWAFFIRKFHISHIRLESLIHGQGNALVIKLLKYLIKGGRITAVTGSQGSGKTTLLMALVGEIYPSLTLRIQETAFELQLRRIYPKRNILTFRETRSISGQQGLDLQKKTDGCVNILGEVATDEVAAWMIQMAQVASLFTLFTHHAKTTSDLVLSLRNSLLKCDVFRDESVAEEQVVSVLNFDIHLAKDYSGQRYIERITEIVPAELGKRRYEAIDIMRYVSGEYRMVNAISKSQVEAMSQVMTQKDSEAFLAFIKTEGICERRCDVENHCDLAGVV